MATTSEAQPLIISSDPAMWPSFLSDKIKTNIVQKGPPLPLDKNYVSFGRK